MRIIYVTASLPYGSNEAYVADEVEELERLGHTVLVVPRSPAGPAMHAAWMVDRTLRQPLFSARLCREAFSECNASGSRVLHSLPGLFDPLHMPKTTLKNLAVVPKAIWLARVARKWGAEHIHCHWAGTTATMTMIASRISGTTWSLTSHRWDIVENNALEAKVKDASFTRVISEGCLGLMSEQVKPSSRVRVLHMGVRLPARAQWNPPESPVVLCPANLVEVKGHRYLLEAWKNLRERGSAGELWLAGGGALAGDLRNLARRLKIDESVRFLGPLPHKTLLGLYEQNRISAVALASVDLGGGHHEGIPVALVEAMGYGVPVIAAATGSIPELIGTAGVLVPPRDPAALADGLRLLLQDRAASRRLSEAGRERVASAFDIRTVAVELERLFLGASPTPDAAVPLFEIAS